MVVFVCPNEPPFSCACECVWWFLCALMNRRVCFCAQLCSTKECVSILCACVCMYAHKFSAISFLLNDFPSAESILPLGVRWQGKQCDWWAEHAHSFRQEGLKIGRRVGQK